jgi:hypothetical protein
VSARRMPHRPGGWLLRQLAHSDDRIDDDGRSTDAARTSGAGFQQRVVLYSCLIRAVTRFRSPMRRILEVVLSNAGDRRLRRRQASMSGQRSAGAFCLVPENPRLISCRRRRRPRPGEKVVHGRRANQYGMPTPGDRPVRRGRPAHVPHSSVIAMGQASGCTTETLDAMTSGQSLPVEQSEVQAFLAKAARGCGRLLNSVMVFVGDKIGLYKTGQYRFDTEDDSARGKLQYPVRTGRRRPKPRAADAPP